MRSTLQSLPRDMISEQRGFVSCWVILKPDMSASNAILFAMKSNLLTWRFSDSMILSARICRAAMTSASDCWDLSKELQRAVEILKSWIISSATTDLSCLMLAIRICISRLKTTLNTLTEIWLSEQSTIEAVMCIDRMVATVTMRQLQRKCRS